MINSFGANAVGVVYLRPGEFFVDDRINVILDSNIRGLPGAFDGG